MSRRPAISFVVLAALALTACTGGEPESPARSPESRPSTAPVPASPEPVVPAESGPRSAAVAAERLCEAPASDLEGGSDVPAEGPTPPVIAQVMREVEQLRGFDYSHPVVAEPVTQREIAADLTEYADVAFPEGQMARRSLAWETIGVIQDGTSLREAYEEYGSSQVIGYYDTLTGTLKFVGTDDPSPLERITLAHELTHAIDDQRFGLEALDVLSSECREEEAAAAIALVEGNATFFMLGWAQTYLTTEEQLQVGLDAALQDTSTGDIPPFVVRLQEWPYSEGLRFVTALSRDGGVDAIDASFRALPISTEQIIHPERYPNDAPTPVDVPDIAAELGQGWEDLDVMTVGEAWLKIALGLRLSGTEAADAASGWDGGTYRAWTDGDEVAVVLSTVWDSRADARAFAESMTAWLAAGDDLGVVLGPDVTRVVVAFGSDEPTLRSSRSAAFP